MIHSTANLGLHGQGSLNLSGPGDVIEAQHLVLSLFYAISVILSRTSCVPPERPSSWASSVSFNNMFPEKNKKPAKFHNEKSKSSWLLQWFFYPS